MAEKFKLNVKFDFAASHFLTRYHGECENLHGHNYKLIATIEDTVKDNGMVIDFKEIKRIVNENVIELVDHKHLNDIIENPSSEHVLIWMWEKLKTKIPLTKLTLYETENYFCEYEGK